MRGSSAYSLVRIPDVGPRRQDMPARELTDVVDTLERVGTTMTRAPVRARGVSSARLLFVTSADGAEGPPAGVTRRRP